MLWRMICIADEPMMTADDATSLLLRSGSVRLRDVRDVCSLCWRHQSHQLPVVSSVDSAADASRSRMSLLLRDHCSCTCMHVCMQ